MSDDRERSLVELVSPEGAAIGTATVAEAHAAPGRLHRAFSVLLIDGFGRTLLQQRSATKTRFPLRWANACCGHPMPGESVISAAQRRLFEELGVGAVELTEVGVYKYVAMDPSTGRVEHEYDHVIVGRTANDLVPAPDPAEVAQTRWVSAPDLRNDVRTVRSIEYSPWLPGVLDVAFDSDLLPGMD